MNDESDIELVPFLSDVAPGSFVDGLGAMNDFFLSLSDRPERLIAGAVITNKLRPALKAGDHVIVDPSEALHDRRPVLARIGENLTVRYLVGDTLVTLDKRESIRIGEQESHVIAPVIRYLVDVHDEWQG